MPDQTPQDAKAPPFGLDVHNPWTYLLPLIAMMAALTLLVPEQPSPWQDPQPNLLGLTYDQYPIAYAGVIVAMGVALWLCRAALRQWPLRVSPLAIVVGVVGVVLWIACSHLGVEARLIDAVGGPESLGATLLGFIGFGAERAAFNPYERIANPINLYAFIAVRFIGLAVLVPIAEELMLRGWLMRTVVSSDFSRVAFGTVTALSVVVGTAFPMLTHGEKLAALVWFTLVTWLMVRTKNFWDCVAAHMVTNFLLGVWVLWREDWALW